MQPPNAWLLDFGQSCRAAVGTRVLLQIMERPKLHAVPCSPAYCHSVLSWQGRLLPVMDMAVRLGGVRQAPRLLAVVGYRDQPDEPVHFAALLLDALPVAISVSNTQASPLPEQPAGWDQFALSCFAYQDAAIPILHLGRIFSGQSDIG
ncbi:MAG: chemotaxis protein CheW [Nitrosomonadales bacterium]|nr:chemotaxis protein CheW [Nitrosomonadales bacterium]